MKQLFDQLSIQVSKATTQTYSTSFSLGIYFLHHSIRNSVYSVYGFARVADEIVDSFEGYDKRRLLADFKRQTYEAIENRISANPILNSFQQTVHLYNIDTELVETFFRSMEMDLEKVAYTTQNYQQYILGSAEVVGLFCLHIFTEGDLKKYELLKPFAMKLGSAFQKVNFLRDLKEDYHTLGRLYFPDIEIQDFTDLTKKEIEKDIEHDFNYALIGIKQLPASSKAGVYLAYTTYKSLFERIKRLPAKQILAERVRIHNGKKFGLMLNSMLQYKMNLI